MAPASAGRRQGRGSAAAARRGCWPRSREPGQPPTGCRQSRPWRPRRQGDRGPPGRSRGLSGPKSTARRGGCTPACTERQAGGLPHWPRAEPGRRRPAAGRRPRPDGRHGQRGRRRHAEGGVRGLRRLRARPVRGPPDLSRSLRPAAPRPGVGRHRRGRRPLDHGRQGHGAGPERLQRAHPGRPPRPHGHRPHPLLDHRCQHLAQRPARVPRRRRCPLRPGAQRQPHEHRAAGRRGRDAPGDGGERQRSHRRARRPRGGRLGHRSHRRAGRRAAPPAGGVLPRAHRPGPRRGRPGSQRLPPAVPRPHGQRLGRGLGVAGARHHRCPPDPRARTGRDGRHRRERSPLAAPVPGRAGRTPRCAPSSSCTSPGPTPSSTAPASPPPGCAWASSWPSRRPSRPTRRTRPARPW